MRYSIAITKITWNVWLKLKEINCETLANIFIRSSKFRCQREFGFIVEAVDFQRTKDTVCTKLNPRKLDLQIRRIVSLFRTLPFFIDNECRGDFVKLRSNIPYLSVHDESPLQPNANINMNDFEVDSPHVYYSKATKWEDGNYWFTFYFSL